MLHSGRWDILTYVILPKKLFKNNTIYFKNKFVILILTVFYYHLKKIEIFFKKILYPCSKGRKNYWFSMHDKI